jgi:hypothetical protein
MTTKTKTRTLLSLAFIVIASTISHAADRVIDKDTRRFLDAIRRVETGGLPNAGANAVGDKGASIGPYQIQRAYHVDARMKTGKYEDCSASHAYSEQTMLSYFARYAPTALAKKDWETLARIHNGGPKGHTKKATLGYWSKVQKEMAK